MSGRALALRQQAIQQDGYFTASQALVAGYVRQDQWYHIRVGNWIRVDRGLFRLPGFADGIKADCIRWCLWSRNKAGVARAVVSHESALKYHRYESEGESSVTRITPDSHKVNLILPPVFHKELSDGIQVHRDTLLPSEIEEHGAWRVTTLQRTLRDLHLQDLAAAPTDATAPDDRKFPKHAPNLRRITVFVELHWEDERRMWGEALGAYLKNSPCVEIETCLDWRNERAALASDLCLATPLFFVRNQPQWAELDGDLQQATAIREADLSRGLIEMGRHNQQLYALPVLRTTQVLLGNFDLFSRYGIHREAIRSPTDLLRLGKQVEEQSRGMVAGYHFWGVLHLVSQCGVDFARADRDVRFDEERMRAFLDTARPFITPRQVEELYRNQFPVFVAGRLAFLHTLLYMHDLLKVQAGATSVQVLPWALAEGGFVNGSLFMGMINRTSRVREEAFELLTHLVSADVQRIFARHTPPWLSVRSDVLSEQQAASPYPRGAVVYDFDPRPYQVVMDPVLSEEYVPKLNSEAFRFFLGRQSLDQTIERLRTI